MKKTLFLLGIFVFGAMVFAQSDDDFFSDDDLFGGSDDFITANSDDDLFGGSDDDMFSDDGIDEVKEVKAKNDLSK